MFRLYLLNIEYNKIFSLDFDSPFLLNKYIKKTKYSKKVQIIGKVKLY